MPVVKRDPAQERFVVRRRAVAFALGGAIVVALAGLAGCGGGDRDGGDLGFVELPREGEEAQGAPLLTRIEPYRMDNGAVRVRGTIDLPDRARLQITLRRKETQAIVGRVQVHVSDRNFDTPPMLGEKGPLPRERYQVEALSLFNDTWQEPEVMRASDGGRRLRGAGMTRDRVGDPVFRAVVERTF